MARGRAVRCSGKRHVASGLKGFAILSICGDQRLARFRFAPEDAGGAWRSLEGEGAVLRNEAKAVRA